MPESNSNTIIENKADQSQKPTRTLPENTRVSILYGALCGLGFALFAWGVDAVTLALNHGQLPFLKFVPGLIFTLLVGSLLGWWRAKTDKGFVRVITWTLYILIEVFLVFWLPTGFAERATVFFKPDLKGLLSYALPNYLIIGIIAFFITVVTILCAVFEDSLSISLLWYKKPHALRNFILISFGSMALLGLISDTITNKTLRDTQLTLARSLEYAKKYVDTEAPIDIKENHYLSSFTQLERAVVHEPSYLLRSNDKPWNLLEFYVELGGRTAICTIWKGDPSGCEWVN